MLSRISQAGGKPCWRLSTQPCDHGHPTGGAGCVNAANSSHSCVWDLVNEGNSVAAGAISLWNAEQGKGAYVATLDTWSMTPEEKCINYEDWVHAPGLAYEQIEVWMKQVLNCDCT